MNQNTDFITLLQNIKLFANEFTIALALRCRGKKMVGQKGR